MNSSNPAGVLRAIAHAIEAAYVRGVEWNDENPLDREYRFKAARDWSDKALNDTDSELCRALSRTGTAGEGGEPVAWRYLSSAKGAKWTVQKNRPTQIEKWPGYTVQPLYASPDYHPHPLGETQLGFLLAEARYRVGNPSAWDSYDDGASEIIRQLVAALAQQATPSPSGER